MNSDKRLKELYTLKEKISVAMLGEDWETKFELQDLKKKVINEIISLEQSLKV